LPPPSNPRPARAPSFPVAALAWTASGFALGRLVGSGGRAWGEAAAQGWLDAGLGWLALDHAARHGAFGPGVLGALLGLTVAAARKALGRLGRRSPARPSRVGRIAAAPGRPLVAVPLLALALVGPRALARATRPAPPAGAPNLLVVLVDTWRADHAGFLGCPRDVTPNLDRLVRSGIVFENAKAQASWTKPSVATLLTGLMPSRHLAVSEPLPPPVRGTDLRRDATTFVEVLRARGWETAMWSNNPHILPARGFAQGAARFFDYVHRLDRSIDSDPGRAGRMLPDVAHWLREERDPSRPFCAYVHVMDPHAPYRAPPEFRGRFGDAEPPAFPAGDGPGSPEDEARDAGSVPPDQLQPAIDAYDEEILSVDAALGPFLEQVRERWPDTVIVVCSDHGEEFHDHGRFGHAHSLYEELTHVPLVIWVPGTSGARIATQVRLMDVFPTVLELTGTTDAAGAAVQGASLLPVIRGLETSDRLAPAENGGDRRPAWHWRALSDGRWKLLRREVDLPTPGPVPPLSPADETEPRPYVRLFDLTTDPGERESLHLDQAARAEALLEAMRAHGWYVPPAELLEHAPGSTVGRGEDHELLRQLGYAGDDG